MPFRKEFLLKERRKIIYIILLAAILQYAKPAQKALLGVHFSSPALDLVYVLAVSYLPSLIYSAISIAAFSLVLSLLKMRLMPAHMLEKKYFGLKDRNLKAVALYSIILAAVLYGIPAFQIGGPTLGSVFPAVPPAGIGGYAATLASFFYYAILMPLYILAPLKAASIASGLLYGAFLIHVVSVRTLQNKSAVYRSCSPPIAQEGSWVSATTEIRSPLPVLSYVAVSPAFKKDGVLASENVEGSTDLGGTRRVMKNRYSLGKGFYSADIAEMWVATPPFFASKIYRLSRNKADVTVIPPGKEMLKARTAPIHTDERSEIVSRKIMGSSSDFAGIKEYAPGDPMNRIWWMGLAKTGQMMTKTFYGTGEDTIILMPDLSDPNSGSEYSDALLAAQTNIIGLCSRKDISLSIFPVCNYHIHAEATRNKKELMFFLMNLGTITMISPAGAEKIFEGALSKEEYSLLRERCNKSNVTLSALYGASGFYRKAAPVFAWQRKDVFRKSTEHFFRHQKKRSKIILFTDPKVPPDALDDFRSMSVARKFRCIAIVLGDGGKEHEASVFAMRERHIMAIPMPYKDAEKVSKLYPILGGKVL